MQVTQEQVSPCEIELNIEVEAEKVNAATDDTYRELARATTVPGFRKGKAPRAILERFLDEEKVKERVADKVLQAAYKEALEETKIEPFAPADVEVVKFETGEPFVFKAKVPLEPKVELGDYVGIEVERNVQTVKDEEVEIEINQMLERHAQYTQITDRAAKEGDTAVLEMMDESNPTEEPNRNVAQVGENLPDFDKGLIGMSVDEEKVIEITYPEDHDAEELRGKTVPLRTKLVELHERKLPDLSDEWVKTTFNPPLEEGAELDPDAVDTADKFRARVRSAMEKAAQDAANMEVENSILKEVVEKANVCFPEVMVDERVHERLNDLAEELKSRKLTFEDYLKHVNMNFEELRSHLAEEARSALRTTLVLHEVIEKENIKVEEDDVKAEVQAMADSKSVPVEAVNAYMDRTDGWQSIRNRILQKKVMDFLTSASNIKNVGDKAAEA